MWILRRPNLDLKPWLVLGQTEYSMCPVAFAKQWDKENFWRMGGGWRRRRRRVLSHTRLSPPRVLWIFSLRCSPSSLPLFSSQSSLPAVNQPSLSSSKLPIQFLSLVSCFQNGIFKIMRFIWQINVRAAVLCLCFRWSRILKEHFINNVVSDNCFSLSVISIIKADLLGYQNR